MTYIAPKYNKAAFDIYELAFGYRAIPYPKLLAAKALEIAESFDGTKSDRSGTTSETLSKLGAVLFKKDENGVEAFCPVTIRYEDKVYELNYATISISMTKNIVKTNLINRRGSVKELIQLQDYKFTINGVMLGSQDLDDADYFLPQDKLADLNELFNINAPVELENAFSDIFLQDDNSVVIEALTLPDMRGVDGAQAYSITVSSDTVLELEEI